MTVRMAIHQVMEKWKNYGRFLRPDDRRRFEAVMISGLNHGDAASAIAVHHHFDLVVMGALIDIHARIEEIEHRLTQLRSSK